MHTYMYMICIHAYICMYVCMNHTRASAYFSSHVLHRCPHRLNIFCNSNKTGHDAGWTAVTYLREPQAGLPKLDIRRTNAPDSGLVARKDMILSQKETSIKNGNMSASIRCYGRLLGPASGMVVCTEGKWVSICLWAVEQWTWNHSPSPQSWQIVTLTKALVGAGKSCRSAETTSGSQRNAED